MKSSTRILLALIISFLLSVFISFSNGRDLLLSLESGFIFAITVATIVAMLSWGMDIAGEKGYSGWVGFLLVLILNVLGLVLLALVPNKTAVTNQVSK